MSRRLVCAVELALLSHALESLAGILDAILIVVAIRGQQPDDLVAAVGAGTGQRAGRVADRLPDLKFVRVQRHAPVTHHIVRARVRRPDPLPLLLLIG